MLRSALFCSITLAVATPALAQQVNLTEKAAPGDHAKFVVELDLKGHLFVVQDAKKEPIRLEAKARHAFAERTLALADGMANASARLYEEATATAAVAGEKAERKLPADRRLVVARRNPDGPFCFSLAGPLTRDELDLVTEHFNPQCLPGLLPGKAVNPGDTWTVSDAATQAACLFDAVIKSQLSGKLVSVKDGIATFAVEGTAEGLENGAKVSLTVTATGTFDTTAGRVTGLMWKQKDEREQGPVNPASFVEAAVVVKRETLTELPKELADEVVVKIPPGDVPAELTDLRHADPRGRYSLTHSRDWHVTGQTDSHLVLRLLDRGEFAAQATVSVWRKVEPGKHTPADDFKRAIANAAGWTPTRVLADGEVPAGAGRRLYRLSAEGKMDELPVIQSFYLLTGPQGDQVAVTVAMKPEKAKVVGTRDTALVNTVEFGKK